MPGKYGGYLILKIRLYNGRLFNRLLNRNPDALYSAEQGKILSALWENEPQSAVHLGEVTGLAKSSLSLMLKRLEAQGLIIAEQDKRDKRKQAYRVTELGRNQEAIGDAVSKQVAQTFYKGFSAREIREVEAYLERININLKEALEKEK